MLLQKYLELGGSSTHLDVNRISIYNTTKKIKSIYCDSRPLYYYCDVIFVDNTKIRYKLNDAIMVDMPLCYTTRDGNFFVGVILYSLINGFGLDVTTITNEYTTFTEETANVVEITETMEWAKEFIIEHMEKSNVLQYVSVENRGDFIEVEFDNSFSILDVFTAIFNITAQVDGCLIFKFKNFNNLK